MTKRGKIQCVIAAALALTGAVLMAVRPWGMRFSGFLLVGLAAVLVLELLLGHWAKASKTGRLCRRIFQTALTLVLVPLICIEIYVINVGSSDPSALPADAVVVLGAGVNGTQPSLSLYTRLTAALDADMEAAACDYEKLNALVQEKETAQAELDALYEKWEQLSEEAGD